MTTQELLEAFKVSEPELMTMGTLLCARWPVGPEESVDDDDRLLLSMGSILIKMFGMPVGIASAVIKHYREPITMQLGALRQRQLQTSPEDARALHILDGRWANFGNKVGNKFVDVRTMQQVDSKIVAASRGAVVSVVAIVIDVLYLQMQALAAQVASRRTPSTTSHPDAGVEAVEPGSIASVTSVEQIPGVDQLPPGSCQTQPSQ